MLDQPLTPSQLRELKPRPPLKTVELDLHFEVPPPSRRPGVRVFPTPVGGTLLEPPDRDDVGQGRRLDRQQVRALEVRGLDGYVPDHLAINPARPAMESRFRRPAFHDTLATLDRGEHLTTTIFAPDQRFAFSDTSFPWSTAGRVSTGGGWGSGTLVGPRHMLCASHMMTWNPDNSVNQVTFTPSYFDGNGPFGNSGIVHWYGYRKVVGPKITNDDIAEDYVVLVLSHRLGDICGWMGTRGYDSTWNGLAVWGHVGYPGDLTGGARPTFQGAVTIDSTSGGSSDEDLWHKGDVWPGQSGGPYFATFAQEPWPRVCGVQSGQNASTNSAGGGSYISNLVNRARNDFP